MSDFLPQDIVVEILLRLPIRSLVSFRCVSKSWNSLITSPNFISAHLNRLRKDNDPLLLLQSGSDPYHTRYSLHFDNDLSFPLYRHLYFPQNYGSLEFRLVGSCNGVVCLVDITQKSVRPLFFWNPLIRRFFKLDFPDYDFRTHRCLIYGFGFDPCTNDFKAVRIIGLVQNSTRKRIFRGTGIVEIYSLKTRSYKSVLAQLGSVISTSSPLEQCIFGGIVHWLARRVVDGRESNFIVSFNPSGETLEKFALPESAADRYICTLSIFEHQGHLAVLSRNKLHCELWVMEEYGVDDSWTCILDFELRRGLLRAVGFREDRSILMVRYSERLVSFDPWDQIITEHGIKEKCGMFRAVSYVESLFLLDQPYDAALYETQSKKRKDRPANVLEELVQEDCSSGKTNGLSTQDEVANKSKESVRECDKHEVVMSNENSLVDSTEEWLPNFNGNSTAAMLNAKSFTASAGEQPNYNKNSVDTDQRLAALENTMTSMRKYIFRLKGRIIDMSGEILSLKTQTGNMPQAGHHSRSRGGHQ